MPARRQLRSSATTILGHKWTRSPIEVRARQHARTEAYHSITWKTATTVCLRALGLEGQLTVNAGNGLAGGQQSFARIGYGD
jgi:hypothetical protein